MKKPVTTLTCLTLVTASAVAYLAPPASGAGAQDATDRKVQGLGQSGLITPAQAEMIKRARAAAVGHAHEANSSMPDPAKKNAAGPSGAQPAPQSGPNGQTAPSAPVPPPAPKAPPKWRLEGTMVGGQGAPSAMFDVEGWGEVLIHPGERLNEHVKVLGIRGKLVTLLTDDKHLERVYPW